LGANAAIICKPVATYELRSRQKTFRWIYITIFTTRLQSCCNWQWFLLSKVWTYQFEVAIFACWKVSEYFHSNFYPYVRAAMRQSIS